MFRTFLSFFISFTHFSKTTLRHNKFIRYKKNRKISSSLVHIETLTLCPHSASKCAIELCGYFRTI